MEQQPKTLKQHPLLAQKKWELRIFELKTPFLDFLQWVYDNKSQDHDQLRNTLWIIEHLNQEGNLENTAEIKDIIIKHKNVKTDTESSDGYKAHLNLVYRWYCIYKGYPYESVKFKHGGRKEIAVPTRERINMIIADAGKLLALKLEVSMNTGLRPVELFNLLVKDFDYDQRLIYPTTAKHGNPRKIKINQPLADRLQAHIHKYVLTGECRIFKGDATRYGKDFRDVRNRLAEKLNDPSIKTIRLYDLRHYFATMDYYKFKDIKRTQYLMGHKHSNTTDIYTHLLQDGEEAEWNCKTASTIKEATQLIEQGFQYVTEMDGIKIFKKRK